MSFSSSVVCSASSMIDLYSKVTVPVGTVGEVMIIVEVNGLIKLAFWLLV